MKTLLLLGVVSWLIGMTARTVSGSQAHHGQDRKRQDRNDEACAAKEGLPGQFVGAWRLASLEQEGADGKTHSSDSTGLLVFTRDGHMSVEVMERSPQAQAADRPEQYSQGGYEASFGTYEIDENSHTFTFHVDGALVRALIGKDLPRAFELSTQQLIVKSARPDEPWRVVWERCEGASASHGPLALRKEKRNHAKTQASEKAIWKFQLSAWAAGE